MELQDCIGPNHLKKVDSNVEKKILDEKISKCVDLTKANISGGTQDSLVEHIVVIAWQHCERFKPANECTTQVEKDSIFGDLKVTL